MVSQERPTRRTEREGAAPRRGAYRGGAYQDGWWLRLLLIAWLGWLPLASAAGQSGGKLTGVVTDAATGEGLAGVSVYLDDNSFVGTVTDADGRYFLLSVPPGTYTLVMSFIGFATLKHENVQVFSGRTTTVDGALQEEVIQGQEVIVSAERPIVVKDRTSTVSFVDQEAIAKLPVQEIGDVIRYQPGVVAGSDGFHFRGGRARETAYLIDGIPVQDVFSQGGGNTVDIEVQSVQELQVMTGTFDAEFGGAQSGIVSITTRDPGRRLEGTARAQAGGFLAPADGLFLGADRLDPVETREVSATINGPLLPGRENLGFFVTARYDQRVGHLRGQRLFTPDDGFKIDTYRRWYRDVYQPQDTRLIALDTARTPSGRYILGPDGLPMTFASGDGAVVNMDWNRSLTINPKFVWRPWRGTKLTYTALYNRDEGQWYQHARRYAPDHRPTYHAGALANIVAVTQTFGDDKFLNLRASYKTSTYDEYAFETPDDPGIRYIAAVDDVTGYSLGETDNSRYAREETQVIASADFTWQINESNEFKTGVQFRTNRFFIDDLDRSWVYADDRDSLYQNLTYPPAGAFETFDAYLSAVRDALPVLVPELAQYAVDDRFEQAPVELGVFVQDKLEIGDRLVVKAGVRMDVYDVRERRLVDPRTPTDRIGRADNFAPTDAKYYVSPRLGISYPISATGAFRVAYGHFVQMPAYRELFKNPVFAEINVGRLTGREVGNPDLQPERTIKYEMGLQQQVTGFLGVDVNLFYKNVRNLLGTEILATLDNVLYTRTVNRDYGLIKGGTLSIVTRPVGMLLGSSLDVTYSDARGSASNPFDVANIVTAGRSGELGDVYMERQIIPLNWDQTLTANVSAQVGQAGRWSVGGIAQLASGQPFTPAFLDPNLDFPDNAFNNAERKPLVATFDLTAERHFTVGPVRYGVRVQVNNVFNRLNEHVVHPVSGRAGQIVRLPVVQKDRAHVLDYVGLFTQADGDANPTWYSAPRQILFAMTLSF